MKSIHLLTIAILVIAAGAAPAERSRELTQFTKSVVSSRDGSAQKVLFYVPPPTTPEGKSDPVPLLVALHTWSGGYEQGPGYLPSAKQRRWALMAPDFRGRNDRPEACASDLAVQDVLDAVAYATKHASVDPSRIYLVGSSGGGHMALMMAARAPQIWAGVSSWVPISDLAAWHGENVRSKRGYAKMMEKVCGGPPGRPETDAQYRARSPLFILPAAKGVPLDINAGIHDGHTGSVPISHSLRAFNVLAEANGHSDKRVPEEEIAFMTVQEKIPPSLAGQCEKDPERKMAVLFRRVAGPVRVTIFEGGHDQEMGAALDWLARQRKGSSAAHEGPRGPAVPPSRGGATQASP